MKKILTIPLICLLVTICSNGTANGKTINADVDLLLIPYTKVLTKLSDEYGTKMYVPEKNKEKLLNNVKEMTPKQFENQLRKQYEESLKYIQDQDSSYDNGEYKSPSSNYIPNSKTTIPAIPLN
ncbi:hypothetical protein M3603_15400 [Rummeliibacillus stabekisii]|uniref:hypothetical protein n=1 Tax=Rummeliibacillus stabekisii TaxID=241244 RepID=UPI00203FA20F|nr:hypothetical protein [Rummeliibacillus stabekisii]MCM3318003.1 hypothetical protein [Rummeliibacillus stabekisii]